MDFKFTFTEHNYRYQDNSTLNDSSSLTSETHSWLTKEMSNRPVEQTKYLEFSKKKMDNSQPTSKFQLFSRITFRTRSCFQHKIVKNISLRKAFDAKFCIWRLHLEQHERDLHLHNTISGVFYRTQSKVVASCARDKQYWKIFELTRRSLW